MAPTKNHPSSSSSPLPEAAASDLHSPIAPPLLAHPSRAPFPASLAGKAPCFLVFRRRDPTFLAPGLQDHGITARKVPPEEHSAISGGCLAVDAIS